MAETLVEIYQSLERSIFKIDNYLKFYEKRLSTFRGSPITLVEVGVFGGGSLELWKRYLHPDSTIIGVDFNPEAVKFVPDGCLFFNFNQENPIAWSDFFDQVGSVDILIDDGGHLDNQQIQTIKSVVPRLNPGGLLFIEDLFFSYRPTQGNPSKRSCVSFLRNLIDEINFKYVEFSAKEVSQLGLLIDEIDFGTAIACISKTTGSHSYRPWVIEKSITDIQDFRNNYDLNQLDDSLIRLLKKVRRGFNKTFLRNNLLFLRFEAVLLERIRTRGFRAQE